MSGQPTRREAVDVAEALAHAAALRGEPAKLLVATFDGVAFEFPKIEPHILDRAS